jgi:hypothetical protein
MIDDRQHALIEKKAYAYDHNYPYYSLIAGEPFLLDDNVFCYFDGKKVSLHLFELEPGRSRQNLARIIAELHSRLDPETLVVWGPDPMETPTGPPGWKRHIIAHSDPFRRDMALMLGSYRPEAVPRLDEVRKYAEDNGIRVTIQKRRQFTAGHILLLKDMIKRNKPDIFDRTFYAVQSAWMLLAEPLVFEAWKEDRLAGYIILDRTLSTLPIMLIGAYERTPSVFSDLLYDAVIRHCIEAGHSRLVMGHSYTEGLFRYKQKWGQCVVQPGTWEILFARPDSAIGPYNYPWLARILSA